DAIVRGKRRHSIQAPRFGLERLEDRIVLSTVSSLGGSLPAPIDSATPQLLGLGTLHAGQTVHLAVDFNTSDPQDQFEGESLILLASTGYSQAISTYGTHNITFPITQDGETVSAYIQGADGDESATISFSSGAAAIRINDTATPTDNITLFNP